jgi:hypothetical protein
MNKSDTIIEIISKYHQQLPLNPAESGLLKEWLSESGEHQSLLRDLENDIAGSEQRIRNKINQSNTLQDDGSANAFEGTETVKEYEKDMSDEGLDELLE